MKTLLDFSYPYFVGIFVFICSVFWTLVDKSGPNPIEQLNNYHEFVFRYGVLFIVFLGMMVRQNRTIPWIFVIYGVFCLVETLVTGYTLPARRAILNVLIGLMFIITLIKTWDARLFKTLVITSISVFACNFVMSWFQLASHDGLYSMVFSKTYINEPTGFMRLNAHLGTITALTVPFLAYLNPFLAILALPLLYFSKSSGAVLGALVGFLIVIFAKLGKLWGFIITGGIVVLAVIYVVFIDAPTGTFGYRIAIWDETFWKVLKYSPVFGFGLGSFALFHPQTIQGNGEPLVWVQAHNEYLQVFFEQGILGLLIVFFYLKSSIIGSIKSKNLKKLVIFGSWAALCVNSIVNFPFHLARLACLACFVIAGLYSER